LRNRAETRRLDSLLALLIANTRRARRSQDIITVAGYMREAIGLLGSAAALAERLGLSEEMVREFLLAESLAEPARALVQQRKVDSVDVVYRISQLPREEQLRMAVAFASGELSSDDVRKAVSFRRSGGAADIARAIERVKASRNIREYVAEFLLPPPALEPQEVEGNLLEALGAANIKLLEVRGPRVRLVLTREGMQCVESMAREGELTKRALLKELARWGKR
jgi:hypothetical protein